MRKINIIFLKIKKKKKYIDTLEEDISQYNKSDERKTVETFEVILKDVNNIGRTSKPVSAKSHATNINYIQDGPLQGFSLMGSKKTPSP